MTGDNYANSSLSRIYLHLPPARLILGYSLAMYRSIHPPKLYLWLKGCYRLCLAIGLGKRSRLQRSRMHRLQWDHRRRRLPRYHELLSGYRGQGNSQFGSFPSSMAFKSPISFTASLAALIVFLMLFNRRLSPRITRPGYSEARDINEGP